MNSPDDPPIASVTVIASPCIRACAIDGRHGLCRGCGRTLGEIANWSQLSPADRDAVMAALPDRMAKAQIETMTNGQAQ